jgi:ribonuclease M5
VIIVTDGFGIYRNSETVRLIRFYAKNTGIIILTDSDSAGQQIRGYIKSIVPDGKITNVYVPEIFGKEKRKSQPSKEGKLGVEGMTVKILREALERVGLDDDKERQPVTKSDFYSLGLSGGKNSSALRSEISRSLNLPEKLSAAALRDAVSTLFDREDFIEYAQKIIGEMSEN